MSGLTPDIINQLCELFYRNVENSRDCESLLYSALGECAVLNKISWDGAPINYIPHMIRKLDQFGKIPTGEFALYAVLKVLRGQVGEDTQKTIEELCKVILDQSKSPSDSALSADLLFNRLLKIDFKDQERLVQQTIKQYKLAAFLIHGESKHGQEILSHRLIRSVRNWQNSLRHMIDVSYRGIGASVLDLWGQVASKLGLPRNSKPEEVIKRICEHWKTKDIIFVFHTVDYMPPDVFSDWLSSFWGGLVQKAEAEARITESETHLIMFLVDNTDRTCIHNHLLVQQIDQSNYPRFPLNLPPNSRFQLEILEEWINELIFDWKIPAELNAQVLLEKSDNGTPDLVYDAVCELFDLNWEGEISRCLY